ncbi:MAG: tRNA pseudouridine(55) synthase TruB [Thermoflexales bacterium]
MDGLAIIDKPAGLSSHDVVARARRVTRMRAIGHAGTLDPMATGVLTLCIGQATRLSEYLLGEEKGYEARVRLGARSNTDDAEGDIMDGSPPDFSPAGLRDALAALTGPLQQVPPQFSAIQRDGQRAYALARKGETVDLPARPVTVYELTWLDESSLADASGAWIAGAAPVEIGLRARVSAGTYIRALARDLGDALGCGGLLSALRRTQAGPFGIASATTLEAWQAMGPDWGRILRPMDEAVAGFPRVDADRETARRVNLGQFPPAPAGLPDGLARVYGPQGRLIAIARIAEGKLHPTKVFAGALPAAG